MATALQLAANARNAQSSTGPRSASGKKRSRANALQHGLTLPNSDPDDADRLDELTRQFAENFPNDNVVLRQARSAAAAQLDWYRVRRVRLALIERVMVFGSLKPPKFFHTLMQEVRWCRQMDRWFSNPRRVQPPWPIPMDPATTMPTEPADRMAEAVRRLAKKIAALERYETRALFRRDHAIRKMLLRAKELCDNQLHQSRQPSKSKTAQNEPNF
jgi:hypothetical protein